MAEEINLEMQPRELLQKVNKAIAAVLVGGQSYRIGTRSLTRADLSMLKKLREEGVVSIEGRRVTLRGAL